MRFEDKVLIALGDPDSRKALFGATLAARLLRAGFGSLDPFTAPYAADAQSVMLAVAPSEPPRYRGRAQTTDGRFVQFDAELADPSACEPLLAAVVEGMLSATLAPVTGRIAAVTTRRGMLPTLAALDVAASAAERADVAMLERRRRIGLARAIAGDALDEDGAQLLADEWLQQATQDRVEDFLRSAAGPAGFERVALRYDVIEPAAPSQRTTRFVAGVVISDPLAAQGPSMLEIVARARAAQRVVRAAGKATAPLGGMEAVVSAPIVWFVPASTFDDDGWPLANGIPANERPARRQERAAAWLASEGIALAAVT